MEDALRLGRILAGLAPREPEVHGLLALMELQASRSRARVGPGGEPILLLDQDRARWDRLLIRRGLTGLERAVAVGGALGPYGLQAAIAACHARALRPEDTDWEQIVALYDALGQVNPSPVIELNRAVAVGMAEGPQAGLELVDGLVKEGSLDGYHLLPGRARRPAGEAGPRGRGRAGVRARGGADGERARAGAAAAGAGAGGGDCVRLLRGINVAARTS